MTAIHTKTIEMVYEAVARSAIEEVADNKGDVGPGLVLFAVKEVPPTPGQFITLLTCIPPPLVATFMRDHGTKEQLARAVRGMLLGEVEGCPTPDVVVLLAEAYTAENPTAEQQAQIAAGTLTIAQIPGRREVVMLTIYTLEHIYLGMLPITTGPDGRRSAEWVPLRTNLSDRVEGALVFPTTHEVAP
jgi:hypothetical protein